MSLPRYEQALEAILASLAPVGTETADAAEALGRTLASPLTVPADIPAGPRSAMDGFAVGSCERSEFQVVGEAAAGGETAERIEPHQAVAIMTGAVVPEGAAAVVMVEKTTVEGNTVSVAGKIRPDDLINPSGSEARAGDPLAEAGLRLGPAAHAAVMCAGHRSVELFRRPRVGLVITGDEVHSANEAPREGGVYDTNSFILRGVCDALGCEVSALRRVRDDEAAIVDLLDELGRDCDVVVTSGGVSKGRYDHVGRILRADRQRLLVAGTAIKPGRPMHVARLRSGAHIFAMPGYPSSMLANVFLYLVPALKTLAGRSDAATAWFEAVLDTDLRHRPGRQDLCRVSLNLSDGRWHARSSGSQTTSHFLNAARSQGLARLPREAPPGHEPGAVLRPAGSTVPVMHFGLELA